MIKLLHGDCRDVLRTLPDASVHCCVTSPPYYGLRDYGTAQWDGGDPDCDHLVKQAKRGNAGYTNGQGGSYASNLQAWGDRDVSSVYRDICGKCGARRIDRQIGLEATPGAFIATMVEVFREVRRVLRDDGTLWLNLGDSYSGSADSGGANGYRLNGAGNGRAGPAVRLQGLPQKGAKPKDLLMMPARVALALQADGWWLRSDIIWAKPNPMPESVTDRPTTAHEHVFLLTKSPRYFFDADAVRESALDRTSGNVERIPRADRGGNPNHPGGQCGHIPYESNGSRNIRNVWTIATAPYADAHFATFPPELAERCIRAGTSERGCCARCGAPWVRQTDVSYVQNRTGKTGRAEPTGSNGWDDGDYPNLSKVSTTTGWSPSCQCGADVVRCTVLDPFAGAGTTGLVADRLGRDAVLIELNPAYSTMARNRIVADAPLFAEVAD